MSDEREEVRTLRVDSSPHIATPLSCPKIMAWVVGALLPAALWALWNMGTPAVITVAFALLGSVGTEWVWNLVARKPQTLGDGTAIVTGLLLAMTLPPRTPWWIALAGGIFAIAVAKMLFGGVGHNLFNPALAGRAFIAVSWSGIYATLANRGWFATLELAEVEGYDAVSGATRLALAAADRAAEGAYGFDHAAQYVDYLFLNLEGSLGEISGALLILGGLVLIARGIVDWRIPLCYLGTMAIVMLVAGEDPAFHVLAGGVLLGAFFMATDYVTSPMTKWGRVVFGIGCGLFNAIGRLYGPAPEYTTFAILFMNGLAPLIDKAFIPRTFGWVTGDG